MSDAHGPRPCDQDRARDSTRSGKFLALRTDTLANMGAYLSTFAPCIADLPARHADGGQLRDAADLRERASAVFTNTVPVDAYRGAGRPEATYQLERVIDKAAREMGIDPTELRRKNFIKPDQFPYQTPVAVQYDTGNYHATLDKLEEISDRAGFAGAPGGERSARQAARLRGSRPRSRPAASRRRSLVGSLGARAGLYESATVRVNATGVDLGLHRQSTATARGTRRPSRRWWPTCWGSTRRMIDIVHGDTAQDPVRHGHLRLAVDRGRRVGDVRATEKIIAKAKKIAAHLMEASDSRRRVRGRQVHRRGHRQVGGLDRRDARGLRAAQLSARGAWSRGWRRRRSTIRRTSPIPPAPTPARSRSIPRPARSRWSGSPPPTTSATSSTR